MVQGSRKYIASVGWPMNGNGTCRKAILFIFFGISIIIVFCYSQGNIAKFHNQLLSKSSQDTYQSDNKYLIHTSKCKIPNDDPFNEEVKVFFRQEKYIPCSKKPLLSYVVKRDSIVTLHINESALFLYSFFKVSCCYQAISRVVHVDEPDNEVEFSECRYFEKIVNITDHLVKVRCRNIFHMEVYSNVHAVISPSLISSKKIGRLKGLKDKPPSVVFIGIDSVSKWNLIRTMPKTYKFLEENDFINLKGYTKIADNTFPNLVAILNGKTMGQVYEHCNPARIRINNCDMIWNEFSNLGYITAYAEDETNINTFHYERMGFSDPPTDFYFRPYLIAAEQLPSVKKFNMHLCSGPENSGERIMNLAKDFLLTFKEHPTFGLFWMNTFSHDNINLPSAMDGKVEEFLKEIYGHLDNTILILLSDHGFRFGEMRYTHTGWLEERLPFIYIHVPDRFKTRHTQEYNNLKLNSKRLSNPFDLHMTLQDILLMANKSYALQQSLACPECHSLFSEIAENRTCVDGAIAQHWCVCTARLYVAKNTPIVRDLAQFIVQSINELIKSSSQGHKCAYYHLGMIKSVGMSEEYVNQNKRTAKYFLIMVETRPPAMFEATVEVELDKMDNFLLLGDISRTNRYADNSKCVNNYLEKYCYCDGIFTSIKSAICNLASCI